MFERRLKILLGALALVTLVLIVRAGQVQIVEHDEWVQAATERMKQSDLIDTVRGTILDRRGKVVAIDQPCVDVCIDYRAITDPPDPKWLIDRARVRLKSRMGDEYTSASRSKRQELDKAEAENIKSDISRMWGDLAKMSGQTPEDLAESRGAIVKKVEMRQRIKTKYNYERAMQEREDRRENEAFWRQWLVEGLASENHDLAAYAEPVVEASEAHVVLRAVSVEVQNYLGKYRDRFPGLELRASTHRTYPFGAAGCHLLGRVSRVNREDLLADKNLDDETKKYLPNDLIGRSGVESLLEPALRGAKGKVIKVPGQGIELSRQDPTPGADVNITIDMELQSKIEAAFAGTQFLDSEGQVQTMVVHGAAVVIDVPTGEVLALASYPTYDLNSFDEMYKKLYDDEINTPLLNRATQSQLQPGSTMKPLVGLCAITAGVITPDQGIECTGYLIIGGKRMGKTGRCWVASKYGNDPRVPSVSHHPIPSSAPHPTGFLTYADALERSCNVFFETVADAMGMGPLSAWMERFGLGRPTGIGIAEARGRLPRSYEGSAEEKRAKTWYSGIGQDPVAVTPIQMANVAATIARGGLWVRPRLIPDEEARKFSIASPPLPPAALGAGELPPTDADGNPIPSQAWPEVYDLQLAPAGLAAAKDGMQRVIYGGAGTGKGILTGGSALEGIRICGKTGTAQVGKYSVKVRDPATGALVKDEKGHQVYRVLEPGTPTNKNPEAPWYCGWGPEGRELNHAWYIGFAPADKPKVAFAVMVEYGGSGGLTAAAIARQALTGCVEQGYLTRGDASPVAHRPQQSEELLHDASRS